MSSLFLRQICADNQTLNQYLKGGLPSIDEIKRNLFLRERGFDYTQPDHYYKNHMDRLLGDVADTAGLILQGFDTITGLYLDFRGNKIIIKSGKMGEWQNLITRIPPLVVTAHALYQKFAAPAYSLGSIQNYTANYIGPNLKGTTLLSPFYPCIEALREENHGFSDLHIHLNGTTEFDHVWLDALSHPGLFYESFAISQTNSRVKEQYEQIEPGLTAHGCYRRLKFAGSLRYMLIEWLYGGKPFTKSQLSWVADMDQMDTSYDFNRHKHPVTDYLGDAIASPVVAESLFFIHAFRFLDRGTPDAFARGLHLYLLLYGFFNKFMVQQVEQNGFDQFQKIADNEGRSSVEKKYALRFEQLAGRTGRDVRLVEGRFAPKDTVEKNLKLLNSISRGYAAFQKDKGFNLFIGRPVLRKTNPDQELNLVAHFIKKEDSKTTSCLKVRHHDLRINLGVQAKALTAAMGHSCFLKKHLVGVDAAANELHAPPEVFAPVYRYLKRKGMVNFTFHVGEDFIHLLSGIRAIHEAVTFLDLSHGNRIGHGTALGIDPGFWLNTIAGDIVISRGEWLDNLIFLYSMLIEQPGNSQQIEKIRNGIECHGGKVYGKNFSNPHLLLDAYNMRYLDPLIADGSFRLGSDSLDMGGFEEWDLVDRERKKSPSGFLLFLLYHSRPHIEKANEMITIGRDEFIDEDLFITLQEWVMDKLNKREVVIESMLTSNLRISFYQSYSQHHLWRWLGLGKKPFKTNPTVCLASDDPGIFATSIQNEYNHVYEQMAFEHNLSTDKVNIKIKELAGNSKRYHFRNQ